MKLFCYLLLVMLATATFAACGSAESDSGDLENGEQGLVAEPRSISESDESEGYEDLTGDQGPVGDQGPAGNAGLAGDQGPVGDTGLAGDTGPVGGAGPAGDAGPAGSAGSTGDAGATGATGATGPVGDKGATGDKGVQGDAGGPTGATGAQGVQGIQGVQGTQGATGLQGPTGVDGIVGHFVVVVLDETHLSRRTVDALCPTGKIVLGGGYSFVGDNEAVEAIIVTANVPITDGSGWRIVVRGPSGAWGIYAYAVCADKV